jgi:hypothetical protein
MECQTFVSTDDGKEFAVDTLEHDGGLAFHIHLAGITPRPGSFRASGTRLSFLKSRLV